MSPDAAEIKVKEYVRANRLLSPGDRIVIGVSGGADSVCLLEMLTVLSEEYDLKLWVVHVNHGIREDAASDAAYVEQLCKERGIPYRLVCADIPKLASEKKLTEEEAGRIVRYEAFSKLAEEIGADRIAVAHNKNDKSETMLLNLFRGTGLKGLGSIRPERDGIIRPILCLERSEIEEYIGNKGIAFCNDSTNAEDDHTRNRIRHHILPAAVTMVNEGAVEHLSGTADMLWEYYEYINSQVAAAVDNCVIGRDPLCISCQNFRQYPKIIQKSMLYELLMQISPKHKDIANVHILQVMDICLNEGNRRADLPFGIDVIREYDRVLIILNEKGEEPRNTRIDESAMAECFTMSKIDVSTVPDFVKKSKEIPQNECTKWMDYDKIVGRIQVRTRRAGDYLVLCTPEGQTYTKKLKDLMTDEKIPARLRDSIPVVAVDEQVLWLVGYRMSSNVMVDENTRHILEIKYNSEGAEEQSWQRSIT